MNMRAVEIGGSGYLRIADAHWSNPLDPSYAATGGGQRWNSPGMPCLYFNQDRQTVEANLRRKIGPFPYARFLDPATAPVILDVELPAGVAADVHTSRGISAAGLPPSYPLDGDGQLVSHQQCQIIGRMAFDTGMDGVDCKSAADGGKRELAWFPRDSTARIHTRHILRDYLAADQAAQ